MRARIRLGLIEGEGAESFKRYVQVCFDKATNTLESTALVAKPSYVSVMNASARFWLWAVQNGLTLVEFLQVHMESNGDSKAPGAGANRSVA